MQHYLSKPKYSPGKIGKLKHIDLPGEFNNVKASMAVEDAIFPILKGDALKKFLFRDDEYKGKGFKMLAILEDNFASYSKAQIAKEMFAFFQDSPQGDVSPDSYEADLRELLSKFSMSGNPLSKSFQLMFMVRGLHTDYGKILLDFCDGTKNFEKEDMSSITAWCKTWDEDTFSDKFKPAYDKQTHCKVKPPASASAAASDKQKDPPGTYATPWENLSAMEVCRISGRWKKLEMKTCVHCAGHVDGDRYKKHVCPGPFACKFLAKMASSSSRFLQKIPSTPLLR